MRTAAGIAVAAACAAGILGASWVRAEDAAGAGAGGNLRYTITVTKFKNEAGWSGQWDVGDGFTTIMTDALQQSGKFVVLGDAEMRQEAMKEQDLATSGRVAGGKKAPKTGRLTPAQLLVRGSITHVQDTTSQGSGGVNFRGISLGGSGGMAEMNITVYLVDSETGQVKASDKVVGKSARKGLSLGYSGSLLGGLTGNLAGMKNDNVGKACEDAVGKVVDFLVKQLAKIPWEGTVMLASPERIVMNRGTREGVQVGAKFDIGQVQQLVDDDTGEVLDVEVTKAGVAEVTEVKEKISYLKPLSGADKIQKGMSALPAK
jgi:curli biogenesis system outer membrane secretion channel CsgG